ncbi:MAG TPA: hypothetical protein VL899_13120 [Alphaproteobacteria bacterium]|jgi:hypothetical protein|nr:hypothetical protein [Alphaproteobacteria bacterium]
MLRVFITAIGALMILGGVIVSATGIAGPALWLFVMGAVLVIGTAFERVFYKPLVTATPGAGWTDTGERFVDPETGKTVKVLYNAASGERQYAVLNDVKATD